MTDTATRCRRAIDIDDCACAAHARPEATVGVRVRQASSAQLVWKTDVRIINAPDPMTLLSTQQDVERIYRQPTGDKLTGYQLSIRQ